MVGGDGLWLVFWILGGMAALLLYGIPAFILLVSKRTNRVAAWIALLWSIFPAGLFIAVRTILRSDLRMNVGDSAPLLSILMLVPAALIGWVAWARIETPDGDTTAALEAPPAVLTAPGPNFIGFWTGAFALDRILWSAAFALLTAAGVELTSRRFELFLLSTASWMLLCWLQWLILKRCGIDKRWIFQTAAAAIAVQIFFELFDGPLRVANPLARAAIYSLAYSAPVAIAQWAALPARLEQRWLWLLALPGAEVCASILMAVIYKQGGVLSSPIKDLLRLVAGVLIGASTGMAMRHILSTRAPEAK